MLCTMTSEPVHAVFATDLEPYQAAERLLALPDLVLLDSSQAGDARSRYSFLTADPFLTLRSVGRRVTLTDRAGARTITADPWEVLAGLMHRYQRAPIEGLPPFQAGAAGYFAYDLARHLERLPATAANDLNLPEMAIGFYDWVLAYDHATGCGWLLATGLPEGTQHAAQARLDQLRHCLDHRPVQPRGDEQPQQTHGVPVFRSTFTPGRYMDAVRAAGDYILAGDIFQVNLSHRLTAPWHGQPWQLYQRLRAVSPVPHGAFLALDDCAIISASPERFLKVAGSHVETRPIKGTRPRGVTLEADEQLARELARSPKDRAENLMIVDLLRNDLGRACEIGSVRVPELFGIEGYANVWQMVSTITGRLRTGLSPVDLLRASFPGGSVTGCPKIRAMEIIEELEPVRRGIYCGAIGYLSFSGDLDTSIVIRTMIATGQRLYLQVGGAVVADSDPRAEYEETLVKAQACLAACNGMLAQA